MYNQANNNKNNSSDNNNNSGNYFLGLCISNYTHTDTHTHTHTYIYIVFLHQCIYIYIYREREREVKEKVRVRAWKVQNSVDVWKGQTWSRMTPTLTGRGRPHWPSSNPRCSSIFRAPLSICSASRSAGYHSPLQTVPNEADCDSALFCVWPMEVLVYK